MTPSRASASRADSVVAAAADAFELAANIVIHDLNSAARLTRRAVRTMVRLGWSDNDLASLPSASRLDVSVRAFCAALRRYIRSSAAPCSAASLEVPRGEPVAAELSATGSELGNPHPTNRRDDE